MTALYDDVDDLAFYLKVAFHHQQPGAEYLFAIFFEKAGPDDEVEGSRFVFERDEADAAGGAWPLADEDKAGYFNILSVAKGTVLRGGTDAEGAQVVADEADGVSFQGQGHSSIVLNDVLRRSHLRK